jgi:hypothetical protein
MKKFLFPHRYKTVSGWIFYLSCLIGIFYLLEWFDEIPLFDLFEITVPNIFRLSVELFVFEENRSFWITNNIFDELLVFLVTISGLINSFSAEPIEDEFISTMRYDALVWSLFVNSGLLLFATAFIYGTAYFSVMAFFLVSILVFFNLRFKIMLYRHYHS